MTIPDDLIIPEAKITQYLLVLKTRNDKSRFLAQAGFTQENPEALKLAIQRQAMDKEAIEEKSVELYQEVALTRDLPEHGLRIGDIAMLVDFVSHPSGGEEGCVLEVFNAIGESLTTIAVPISVVEALRSDEVLSVRPLARAS